MIYNKQELINIINNDINVLEQIFNNEDIFDSSIGEKYKTLISTNMLFLLLDKIKNKYSYYFLCIISIYTNNYEKFVFLTNKYNLSKDEYLMFINLIINNNKLNKFVDYIEKKITLKETDLYFIYINACKNDNIYIYIS